MSTRIFRKESPLVLAAMFGLMLFGAPAKASGQNVWGPPLRSWMFFGCNPGLSCHRTTVNVSSYDPSSNQPYGHVFFQHWYFLHPGMTQTSIFTPPTGGLELDFETYANSYEWYYEETLPLTATTGGWRPTSVRHLVGYGTNAGDIYGDNQIGHAWVTGYAVPEPMSMLLVATGVLAIGGMRQVGARRRRSAGDKGAPARSVV